MTTDRAHNTALHSDKLPAENSIMRNSAKRMSFLDLPAELRNTVRFAMVHYWLLV
jgi:hypothetical protein